MSILVLDGIILDPELQPRAEIDRTVLENYVQLLVDGAVFPPVMVFRTDEGLLLADGFHRWHTYKVLGRCDRLTNRFQSIRCSIAVSAGSIMPLAHS